MLLDCQRQFFSLRKTARVFGISTQPLRDWIRRGDITRDGPRQQFSKEELLRFVTKLKEKAEPYDMETRWDRFYCHRHRPPWRFEKLRTAKFVWPKGQKALTPSQLAALISCHRSLVIKAIKEYSRLGHHPTPGRWQITKTDWTNNFFFTLITKPRLPTLPQGELITTRAAADHLLDCGMKGINQRGICDLIKTSQLEGVHCSVPGRKWFVTRASLDKFRQKYKKTIDTPI
jgi:hypothetical protein